MPVINGHPLVRSKCQYSMTTKWANVWYIFKMDKELLIKFQNVWILFWKVTELYISFQTGRQSMGRTIPSADRNGKQSYGYSTVSSSEKMSLNAYFCDLHIIKYFKPSCLRYQSAHLSVLLQPCCDGTLHVPVFIFHFTVFKTWRIRLTFTSEHLIEDSWHLLKCSCASLPLIKISTCHSTWVH